ncbi:MAG: oligosaccharide flippase family protein [Akkermansiaceae bacterium]|nr:oligosaccharide flippase family protein [Akkermansiaceae bacterium]
MASELKAGVCLNYVSIAIRLGTSFFLTPFIIERLGVNEYGLFMLSGTVIAWLSLTDFGLGATVSKYAATYHAKGEAERESHFLGQAMMLFSALGLLTFLIGIACYFSLSSFFPDLNDEQMETLRILYLLTLGNLVLAFPLRPIGCVPGAHMKFIVPGVVHLVLSLLNAGLTVLLLCLGYKAIGLTVLVVGVSVAGLAWGLYYVVCRMGVRLLFRKPDTALYREMFGFSFWMNAQSADGSLLLARRNPHSRPLFRDGRRHSVHNRSIFRSILHDGFLRHFRRSGSEAHAYGGTGRR